MDGGFGAILLLVLVPVALIIAVIFLVALVGFGALGSVGVMALVYRFTGAKRRESEADPEDEW